MNRLSSPLGRLGGHYDVVVVGSGYGGAITAARLAGAKKSDGAPVRLAVLERGREIRPGSFPRTFAKAARSVQLSVRGRTVGSPVGLYDIRVERDVALVQGCGLGGTSLINANVVLEPSPEVRAAQEWPRALQLHDSAWSGLFDEVRGKLGARPYPEPTLPGIGHDPDPRRWPRLRKLLALDRSGTDLLPRDSHAPAGRIRHLAQGGLQIPSSRTHQKAPQGHPPLTITAPDIAVSFEPGRSFGGVSQGPCTLCGDCVTGCNHGAKNTLPTNYLAAARHGGAEIFCEVGVRSVSRRQVDGNARWVVWLEPLVTARELYRPPPMWITADVVVLAAGSLGSTEILLRSSRKHGGTLDFSERLGERFSGNGDAIAFGYNCDAEVHGFGTGKKEHGEREATGPTITGVIDLRHSSDPAHQVIVEDAAIPGALGLPARLLLTWFGWVRGTRTTKGWTHWVRQVFRSVVGLLLGGTRGALRNTQTYLVMAHDGGRAGKESGRLVLHEGRLRIDWPGVGTQDIYQRIDRVLYRATKTLAGIHVANPLWSRRAGKRVVTVHPLGGCTMANDASQGVVNHAGSVFDPGGSEDAVYDGLYVNDGAVVPRSLGANPLLTISAIAERNARMIAETRGWSAIEATHDREPGENVIRPGLRFSERLRGWVEPADTAPFEVKRGRIEAVLTIDSDDLWHMSRHGSHEAGVYGTLTWPCEHGREPLTVTGTFRLFDPDPRRAEARKMRYDLVLRAKSGDVFALNGRKTIYDDPRNLDMWGDITRMRFELRRADEQGRATGPVVATGQLCLRFRDVFNLLRSIRITHATSGWKDLAGRIRFGLFYVSCMISQFAWLIRRSDIAHPYSTDRTIPYLRKPTDLCAEGEEPDFIKRLGRPESGVVLRRCRGGTLWVQAADGAVITLTRHRQEGARNGPILMAPGFGTSTIVFSMSTNDRFTRSTAGGGREEVWPKDPIEFVDSSPDHRQEQRSFTDYLVGKGYDVWLLDYRVSELSDAAGTQFTLDDIARYDWPAAVQAVLRIRQLEDTMAGRERTQSVQVLGHCVGSLTLLMSILGGHLNDGVRSIICSQSLTHVDQPWINRVKARLHLATVLHLLGGWPTHNPDFDSRSSRTSRAIDAVLRLMPWERCRNPVCRRIQFLYGSVNRHEQLSAMTHDAMHEMFNEANTRTFEHLSRIIRAERIVDAQGRNIYLTRETGPRMRLPVGLLQGEANPIFRPKGLQWTYDWLVENAGRGARLPDDVGWRDTAAKPGLFKKIVVRGRNIGEDRVAPDKYGHMDCFIGRNALDEVFPVILDELERGDRVASRLRPGRAGEPWTITSPLQHPHVGRRTHEPRP